jgi:hypothetical protein
MDLSSISQSLDGIDDTTLDAVGELVSNHVSREEAVGLLAEALQATTLADDLELAREEGSEMQALLANMVTRIDDLEAYIAETPSDPSVVANDELEFILMKKFYKQQQKLRGSKWDTPSDRKGRAHQLRTIRANAVKLDVQRQKHAAKVHTEYVKAAALQVFVTQDGRASVDDEKALDEEFAIKLAAAREFEKVKANAEKKLSAHKANKKRRYHYIDDEADDA